LKLTELLTDPGRPVAFYPRLRALTGSTNATVLLCQLIYWQGKQADTDGWIQKRVEAAEDDPDGALDASNQSIEMETGLTYCEQATARRQLRDRGFLRERRDRADNWVYFQVDLEAVERAWAGIGQERSRKPGLPTSESATANLVNRDHQPRKARLPTSETATANLGFRGSLKGINIDYTETTAETPADGAAESPAAPASEKSSNPLPPEDAEEIRPTTPVEAMRHPDIALFQQISGRLPGADYYQTVIETMRYLRAQKGEGTVEYLRRFWLAWSGRRRKSDGKPYDPGSLTWLTEWALNGTIPPEHGGTDAAHPRRYTPKPLTAADLDAAERISARNRERERERRLRGSELSDLSRDRLLAPGPTAE
jgi:hypothetical protein